MLEPDTSKQKFTVAVTGASGHIGNVVCRKLLEKGYRVRALYHSDSHSLAGLAVERVQGSVLVPADLLRLMEDCRFVIHCAARISIDGDKNGIVFKTNTEGPKNVLEAARQSGVKRIIHLSSVHAVCDLPHETPYNELRPYKNQRDFVYDYSKAVGEQTMLAGAQNGGMEVIALRPSCVVGPYDFKPSKMGRALKQFFQQKILFVPPGGYDIVDVRDVAEAAITALTHGQNGSVYLISGKYARFSTVVAEIQRIRAQKKPVIALPYWLLRAAVPCARLAEMFTGTPASITRESIAAIREGHPEMDHSKAKTALNHHPRPLTETLTDFFNWTTTNR